MHGYAFVLSSVLFLLLVPPSIVALRCLMGKEVYAAERDVSANCTHCFVASCNHAYMPTVTLYGCLNRTADAEKLPDQHACMESETTYSYSICTSEHDACNRNATATPPVYQYGEACLPHDQTIVEQFSRRNYTGSLCAQTVFNAQCEDMERFRPSLVECPNKCRSNATHIRCSFGFGHDAVRACREYIAAYAFTTAKSGSKKKSRKKKAAKSSSSIFARPEYIAVLALVILVVILLAIVGVVYWIARKRRRKAQAEFERIQKLRLIERQLYQHPTTMQQTTAGQLTSQIVGESESGVSSMASPSSVHSRTQTPDRPDKSTPRGETPVSGRDRSEKASAIE